MTNQYLTPRTNLVADAVKVALDLDLQVTRTSRLSDAYLVYNKATPERAFRLYSRDVEAEVVVARVDSRGDVTGADVVHLTNPSAFVLRSVLGSVVKDRL